MKEIHPDHDTHWKELIEKRFWKALAFFLPMIYAIADQSKDVEFLDKELHKLIADKFKGGNTRKDKLAKIYLKNGKEHYVLIHFEVQVKFDKDFLRRMFVYFYRIFDKREENITALVIYTGDSVPDDCDTFVYEFMGTKVVYQFNVYRVCKADEAELLADDNPMALAVLAAMYLNETKNDKELRYTFKRKLIELAYDRGWTDDEVDSMLQFIYLLVILPNNLEPLFENELRKKYDIMNTTAKRKIPLIEDLMKKRKEEREKREKARQEGLQLGLQEGREEGLQVGRIEGREEGLQVGREEGLQEGRQRGKEEGFMEAKIEGAKKLLLMTDLSVEQIAEIQELPIEVVLELQKEIESEG